MVVAALKPQDVQKLTVVKLRAELEKRKLDSSGTKPILVARLKEALEERDDEEEEGKGGKDADAKEREKSEEAEQTPATEEEDAKGNELETTTTFENKEEETTTTTTTNDDEIMDPAPSVETDEDIDPAFDAHDDGANPIVKSNRLTNARKILRRNPYDATAWDALCSFRVGASARARLSLSPSSFFSFQYTKNTKYSRKARGPFLWQRRNEELLNNKRALVMSKLLGKIQSASQSKSHTHTCAYHPVLHASRTPQPSAAAVAIAKRGREEERRELLRIIATKTRCIPRWTT